jgi:hypothetical protein
MSKGAFTMSANDQLNKLIALRQDAYHCLGPARDALFELTDAVMLTSSPPSLAHLSMSPVFRRRWPSLYEALQDGRPDPDALATLYSKHVGPTPTTLSVPRVILAVDHTAWSLPASPTLPGRTYQHKHTQTPNGRPVTVGYGFSSVAWIPESQGSWALPLFHQRIRPSENTLSKAASQLRKACQLLGPSVRPLSLLDSQYGCAPFVKSTTDIASDKLMRLRGNLCLRKAPPPYTGHGHRCKHGEKFKLKDEATWGEPDEWLEVEDPKLKRVEVRLWKDLHFRSTARHPMRVLRIFRPGARGTRRDPKAQWLAWVGEEPPPLEELWGVYGRRFALDHWYRFAKVNLHWTLPHLGTAEQYERWSDLMPLITWELWLGRGVVCERVLPWQEPQVEKLTPGRVCQSMGGVMVAIGTEACVPKARGKSPGWPKGKPRRKREVYPVIRKSIKRAREGDRRGGRRAA